MLFSVSQPWQQLQWLSFAARRHRAFHALPYIFNFPIIDSKEGDCEWDFQRQSFLQAPKCINKYIKITGCLKHSQLQDNSSKMTRAHTHKDNASLLFCKAQELLIFLPLCLLWIWLFSVLLLLKSQNNQNWYMLGEKMGLERKGKCKKFGLLFGNVDEPELPLPLTRSGTTMPTQARKKRDQQNHHL